MYNEKYIDISGTPHVIKLDISAPNPNDDRILRKEALAYTIGDMSFVLISNDGDLFNPFDSSANRNKKDLEKGDLFYNLKRCNKTCFDYYVMFLRTKNKTHLTLAQRNYLN
jgi:hypothetical protein